MYHTAQSLIAAVETSGQPAPEVILQQEAELTGERPEALRAELSRRLEIMRDAAERGREAPLSSLSGLTGGNAHRLSESDPARHYLDPVMLHALARATSVAEVNSHMGKIVAAPTAGAAGILPAALFTAQERHSYGDDVLVDGLLVAAAVGAIIAQGATIAGAEGGCQAECGAASAMAAAALVTMAEGDLDAALRAAGFAILAVLGLVCDPVGGLVEFPCALRNAHGVMNAFTAADLALAGVESLVPFDEVVAAMDQVGRSMPMQLRETALGGIAQAPSAKAACRACHKA